MSDQDQPRLSNADSWKEFISNRIYQKSPKTNDKPDPPIETTPLVTKKRVADGLADVVEPRSPHLDNFSFNDYPGGATVFPYPSRAIDHSRRARPRDTPVDTPSAKAPVHSSQSKTKTANLSTPRTPDPKPVAKASTRTSSEDNDNNDPDGPAFKSELTFHFPLPCRSSCETNFRILAARIRDLADPVAGNPHFYEEGERWGIQHGSLRRKADYHKAIAARLERQIEDRDEEHLQETKRCRPGYETQQEKDAKKLQDEAEHFARQTEDTMNLIHMVEETKRAVAKASESRRAQEIQQWMNNVERMIAHGKMRIGVFVDLVRENAAAIVRLCHDVSLGVKPEGNPHERPSLRPTCGPEASDAEREAECIGFLDEMDEWSKYLKGAGEWQRARNAKEPRAGMQSVAWGSGHDEKSEQATDYEFARLVQLSRILRISKTILVTERLKRAEAENGQGIDATVENETELEGGNEEENGEKSDHFAPHVSVARSDAKP